MTVSNNKMRNTIGRDIIQDRNQSLETKFKVGFDNPTFETTSKTYSCHHEETTKHKIFSKGKCK